MQRPLAHPFMSIARTLIILIVVFCVFGFLAVALPAGAQETTFEQFGDATTLPQDSIAIIIARVIRVAISLVGIIFVGVIIYAGFLYLLARGEPEPIKKAKKIFQQSIIGLILIFSAYSITTFILNRLLGAAFGGTSVSVADRYSESLSGSLGGGILDDHYPERNATEIPRNTRMFVTFKEAIDPASMIKDFDGIGCEATAITDLNTESVLIYPTAEGVGGALDADEVEVSFDESCEIFVFDPVEYLGSPDEDTNYTVYLTTNIEKEDGSSAFSGTYSSGYAWTFEVSTEIDLTPPYVTSVVPQQDADEPRNVTIEINFSEAMDPVATTGSYIADEDSFFANIQVSDESGEVVEGTFEISNAYRTISFTTTVACGEDPCGDTIFCLPAPERISAIAKAATLKKDEIPQAKPIGYTFDGVVDAASNSLGDSDGESCGSSLDDIVCDDGTATSDYEWSFTTNDEIEDTVPQIIPEGLDPGVDEDEISTSADVEVTFNIYLKSSTVNTSSVSLWPDPYYEMWFAIRKENADERTTVLIEHPAFVSIADYGWDYWPVLSEGIKSAYQICMYPAIGPEGPLTGTTNACTEGRDSTKPWCCNGVAQANACSTDNQTDGEYLPDNTETEL